MLARLCIVPALLAAATLSAQTITAPAVFANAEGGSSANIWRSGITRNQGFYDTTNFTSQGITYPIVINNLEWRLAGGLAGASVTYPSVELYLGYSANNFLTPSTTFAANRTASHTLVYSGPITVNPAAGTTPNSFVINQALTTTFTYDPTLGHDLLLEIVVLAAPSPVLGSTMSTGYVAATHMVNSVRNTSSTTSLTGSASAFCCVCRFGYSLLPGTALNEAYGAGCGATYASFYEGWLMPAPAAAALSNTSITMTLAGPSYIVTNGGGTYVPPSPTATNLALGDDSEVAVTLSSALSYPGGSTTSLMVCSNGFISAGVGNGTNWVPTGTEMLAMPQTVWVPLWSDWSPNETGSGFIKFEEVGGVAYVTWDNVERYLLTTVNPGTVQVQFDLATGNVRYVWGTLPTVAGATGDPSMVGYSPGGASPDPGPISLATSLPFVTAPVEMLAMGLGAAPRPLIGTSVTYTLSNINPGALLSAHIISLGGIDPGISLAGIGAPGCFQYIDLSIASTMLVFGGPTATSVFGIPNDLSFVGLPLDNQAASLVPGINALGATTSNAVVSTIGSL